MEAAWELGPLLVVWLREGKDRGDAEEPELPGSVARGGKE